MTPPNAQQYECHFLQSLMARWPRRGRSLVQFGCAHGEILEHFWESGFDVTGLDTEHDNLEAAKERMGQRADWHLGPYDQTPFEDNEFDYAVLYHMLENTRQSKQEAVLKEALRLANRGVVIVVKNPWSLANFNASNSINVFRLWCMVRRMVRRMSPSALTVWGSALHGPRWTWNSSWKWPWHWSLFSGGKNAKATPLFGLINQGHRYSPFGATLFMRIDLGRGQAMTPLLLRTRERVQAATMPAYPPTVLGNESGRQASAFIDETRKKQS